MLDRERLLTAMRGEIGAAELCAAAGITEEELTGAIEADLRSRLPPTEQRITGGVTGPLEILRDRKGIPHIYAAETRDLFFGLGLAMGQDRLWQMDFTRRRGQGRLAEILGEGQLESDVTHRTVELDRLAARDAEMLDDRARDALDAFVAGVNRALDLCGERLPVEFDLLGYRPEPWRVVDILAALRGFWWQLNGRLAAIAIGEAAARHLPAGPLLDAFMTPEFAHETIVPGAGSPLRAGTDASATGSNNWAVGRGKTRTGAGVIGSDPHLPFLQPSNWYECRLVGPEDDSAGAAWAGVPGLFFGRNQRIAWGLTNNNASLRDLYVETVDPADPTRYRDGDEWRTFATRELDIPVRGRTSERLTVRSTTRGPIVNHIVPTVDPAGEPPLSLKWIGQEPLDTVGALIAMNRAQHWTAFRAAFTGWTHPTFNWVFADVDGAIGYQCAAHIPIRGRMTRGFRDATNPLDQWQGMIPYDEMPRRDDPDERFLASANNAATGRDAAMPIYGAFASGDRAVRIREVIGADDAFDAAASRRLQLDVYSPTAAMLIPAVLRRAEGVAGDDVALFRDQLSAWSFRYDPDETAPVFFDMFQRVWTARIAAERFPPHLVALMTGQGSVGAQLLESDDLPWFTGDVGAIVIACIRDAVAQVTERFGSDPAGWAWKGIHLAHFKHPLSNPLLSPFVDVGPAGVSGGMATVRNTGSGGAPLFSAASGAEYQIVVDLGDDAGYLANQSIGQSGQPGSPHYGDQFADWIGETYHTVSLRREDVEAEQTASIQVTPTPLSL